MFQTKLSRNHELKGQQKKSYINIEYEVTDTTGEDQKTGKLMLTGASYWFIH